MKVRTKQNVDVGKDVKGALNESARGYLKTNQTQPAGEPTSLPPRGWLALEDLCVPPSARFIESVVLHLLLFVLFRFPFFIAGWGKLLGKCCAEKGGCVGNSH